MATATKTKLHITPDLGLDEKTVDQVADILKTTLADEFTLRLKLRKYHWNVTGHQFRGLHELFEEQYTALAEFIDEVAERLRSYGKLSPGTMQEFLDMTRLEENPGEIPSVDDMVTNLVQDHESLVRYFREDIKTAEEELEDVGLADFLTGQLQVHQEMAWMLRSFLQTDGLS